MATDTQAQQDALRAQRTKDLQLAAASTNPAGAAHDRAQATALRTEIQTNARANNAAAVAAAAPASTPAPVTPTPQQQANTANQQSASASIAAFLSSVPGLSTLDPTGQLAAWMNGQVSTLAGQGIDSSTIVNTIEDTMNNPTGDPAAAAVFDQIFPGYNQKIQAGTTNANGSYTGIAGYLQYANQINAYANTAGLLPGTITAQDIGAAWAGDVSADEMSTRLTTDYANAANAWNNIPGFRDAMAAQGMTSLSQLASYYVNPANTLAQINQQISAGQLGAESTNTGFGPITAAQSNALSAFLTNSGTNQLTTQQANAAFTSNLGNNVQGSAAQLAAGGYEQATPGQSDTGTVSQGTLLAGIEGNASALQQTEHAQEARTAGSKGGGGATTTANGAVGVGFANS